MRLLSRSVLVGVVLAVAVGACSWRMLADNRPHTEKAETPREQAADQIAQGHALLGSKQYDKAMDAFVAAAAYKPVMSEAVSGAVTAMHSKTAGDRLPDRLDAAAALWKRLPTTADRDPLRIQVQVYLLSAIVQETKKADRLLNDRRKFVQDMWDNDEGDVRATKADGRILSEDEVQDAEAHMRDLEVPYSIMDLYIKHEAVAAALQRFADDDAEYLQQEVVSDEALDEMGNANSQLADSLWPVQRRLDKLQPGWRQSQ